MNDGTAVSARVKSTNKIVEGLLFTRSDGSKVILQESGKWTRLSSCEHMVIRESLDDDSSSGMTEIDPEKKKKAEEMASGIYNNLSPEVTDKQDERVEEEITEATGEVLEADEDIGLKSGEGEPLAKDQFSVFKMEKAADGATGGNVQKAQQVLKKYSESLESLASELGGYTEDLVNDEDEIDEIEDLFDPEDLVTVEEEEIAQEEAPDYVDPDFCSLGDDVREDAIASIMDMLSKEEETIRTHLLDNYEISEDEADEFILEAYSRAIDSGSEEDEVDQAYEEAIDECPDPECPLDFLCERFLIPQEDAERMIRESRSTADAVLRFAEYTRRRALR